MAKQRWERREEKRKAKRNRMPKTGRSVFNIQRLQWERAEQIRKEKEHEQPTD